MKVTLARAGCEANGGRGAAGKTPVFGLLKSSGRVYTEIVPNCKKATLQAIIRGRVAPQAVIHSDGWRGYDGLVDVGYARHFRVQQGSNQFACGQRHINGIESFWSFAKWRLQKFNGVPTPTFYVHLRAGCNGASTIDTLTSIMNC